MNVLAVIRQSKRKEHSESPETQRQDIQRWAEREGHTIVAEAVDLGVSASVSPFDRKNLGPWLRDPEKLAQFDIVAVWKVDRIVRDMTHFYGELMPGPNDSTPGLRELGKAVVATSENVNTLTASDIEIAMRVSMASEELKKIKDRARNSRRGLRQAARWPGGIPPFGYYTEHTPQGVKLVIDTEAMEALYSVFDHLKNGRNLNYCLRWLTQEQVLTAWDRHAQRTGKTPKGRVWRWRTLETMLQSRHLLGQMTHKGDVIRDGDGEPRQFAPPLVSRDDFNELQALLNRPKRNYKRSNGSMLRHVAYCAYCGSPLRHRRAGDRDIRRYYCASRDVIKRERECYESAFPADLLEKFVEELFLDHYGDREIVEVKATKVVDHSARLSQISEQLDQLETDRYIKGRFQGDDGERRFDRLYGQLESERDELEAAQQAQGVDYTGTGQTYREKWEAATPDERGDLLRYFGVYVMAQWPRSNWSVPLSVGQYLAIDFPWLEGR